MKKRILAPGLLLATALAAAPSPTLHVVPVSGQVRLSTPGDPLFYLGAPTVAATAPGEFVVAWASDYTIYQSSQPIGFEGQIRGRKVGQSAQPLTPEFPIAPLGNAFDFESPRIAGNASGRFVVAWERSDGNYLGNQSQLFIESRQFGADAQPLGPTVPLYTSAVGLTQQALAPLTYTAVGMDPAGRSFVSWLQPLPLASDGFGDLEARTFDAAGKAASPPLAVTRAQESAGFPATAIDGRGISTVVYEGEQAGVQGLYLRRYDARGLSLGDEIQLTAATDSNPKVAATADGRFVVAWSEGERILAQRFDSSGQKTGSLVQVSQETHSFNRFPDLSMDARGNFVVAWEGNDDSRFPVLLTRLLDSAGVPQGPQIELYATPEGSSFDPGSAPRVALADNGTFLVTWNVVVAQRIFARAFRAVPNRDRCVYRGDTFLCGAPGGDLTPLVQLGHGVAAGDVPLLGDLDGDGVDDPCAREGNTFLCALSGSQGAVQTFPFGAASQPPLLGDIDGDGKADLCVRRGRFFLCDTAHDGGGAEVKIPFGLASDPAFLGDVDGDGRADPCVFRDRQFLCDTTHDGIRDLIQPEDVQAGDVPLLGDADGDGRADFCVVRGGTRLLCDLGRTGTLSEQPLAIEPGDVVLLGKVDRL